MQSARPDIPQTVSQGEAIRASLINQLIGLAGYFQDQPIDAIVPGENIYVGRPALMRVASVAPSGPTETVAWDNGGGRVYGLVSAIVLNGGSSGASPIGAYLGIQLNSDQWPGVCLTEINGGNNAYVGDFVMGYPLQTPNGPIFVFDGPRPQLYRVSDPVVIIADRKWSYTLVPQVIGSDGISWNDDAYGTPLTNAMNEAEALNTAGSTLQSNDIDFSLPPFGTTTGTLARILQPIKENRMVSITRFTQSTTGSGSTPKIPWFNAPNVVQEGCIA